MLHVQYVDSTPNNQIFAWSSSTPLRLRVSPNEYNERRNKALVNAISNLLVQSSTAVCTSIPPSGMVRIVIPLKDPALMANNLDPRKLNEEDIGVLEFINLDRKEVIKSINETLMALLPVCMISLS